VIKINKGACPPGLAVDGAALTASLCKDFDADRSSYESGSEKFSFDTNIYGSDEVREALLTAQHNKCCYSEAKLVLDQPHVEHFRPKGRVQPDEKERYIYPGYYWLAYDWSNLLLSKPVPNTSYKRTLFPLLDESKRNRNHRDRNAEEPALIHPAEEDPRDHIRFDGAMIYSYLGSVRGRKTIELLGLDSRIDLRSDREERYELLRTFRDMLLGLLEEEKRADHPVIIKLMEQLREACEPHSIYSSMAIDFVLNDDLLKSILHIPQNPAAAPAQPESPPSDQP
jgi:uncharacterized protein (TIGR02646 family)